MPARGRRSTVEPGRFVGRVPGLPDPLDPPVPPDLVVDVVRGVDLVAVRVEVYGAALVADTEPVIRWGDDGWLIARIGVQHIAERAIYEVKVDLPYDGYVDTGSPADETQPSFAPPEQARPAKGSRLVFEVPARFEIPFTTSGILGALTRLQMATHPLAIPRPFTIPIPDGPIVGLPGGVVGIPTAGGLVIASETNRRRGPDVATTTGLVAALRDRRMARAIVARLGAVPARGVDLGATAAPGVEIPHHGGRVRVPPTVGVGGIIPPVIVVPPPRRPRLSREPEQFETAIEAPYRLIISPSAVGGWAHATEPVTADDAPHRVELWHSRLGVRTSGPDDAVVDEALAHQRIIRAVWARDREAMDWQEELKPDHADEPFRTSLDGADRHMLVRQSAETWIGRDGQRLAPGPVDARGLALSAVGAWLDLHGSWDTDPYTEAKVSSIESWDHVAPMGRDQFVKVVYPGFLWPFGHRASLVKLTERKMRDAAPSIAGLYQRMFLVIKEPLRRYRSNDMPLTEVRIAPLVTPTLDPPPTAAEMDEAFVPKVGGLPFAFVLHSRDHEDRAVRLVTPLTWVAAAYTDDGDIRGTHAPHATIPADGQKVAFAPVQTGGDTVAPAVDMTFDAEREDGTCTPRMPAAHPPSTSWRSCRASVRWRSPTSTATSPGASTPPTTSGRSGPRCPRRRRSRSAARRPAATGPAGSSSRT